MSLDSRNPPTSSHMILSMPTLNSAEIRQWTQTQLNNTIKMVQQQCVYYQINMNGIAHVNN